MSVSTKYDETDPVLTGDVATIFYGTEAMHGTVTEIKHNTDGSVRLIGVTPNGADCVTWFAPSDNWFTFVSVGGFTLAYM